MIVLPHPHQFDFTRDDKSGDAKLHDNNNNLMIRCKRDGSMSEHQCLDDGNSLVNRLGHMSQKSKQKIACGSIHRSNLLNAAQHHDASIQNRLLHYTCSSMRQKESPSPSQANANRDLSFYRQLQQ